MAALRLELDKLLGHLIVCPLRENAQDGPSRFVEADALAYRAPARARALLHNVPQLQHRDAYQAVLTRKAVVLGTDVQLVRVRLILVAKDTETSAHTYVMLASEGHLPCL